MTANPSLTSVHVFQKEDDDNCGPSCLSMIYALRQKQIPVAAILTDLHIGEKGEGTYPAQLAHHLMSHGLKTRLTVSHSRAASPAWSRLSKKELIEQLKVWAVHNPKAEWLVFVLHMLFYLEAGGDVILESYDASTIRQMIDRKSLVLVCVDEVWLWGHRFLKHKAHADEIKGDSFGHYVVVTGYTAGAFELLDPYPTNLSGKEGAYSVPFNQLVNASLTWAGTLVEITQ